VIDPRADASTYDPAVAIDLKAEVSPYSGLELLRAEPEGDPTGPPILFVHGAGHAAWCWRPWMEQAAESGRQAFAVSLTGHGASPGPLATATVGTYVEDVVRTAAGLDSRPVLVGHSLGGLVVQKAMARYPVKAAILVAPIPARPGAGTLLKIAARHPADLLKISLGGSLPMRPDYLFEAADRSEAERWAAMCGRESPIAQFEVLLHLPAGPPKGDPPVLVLGTPDDALIPISDVRDTASRYGAELLEFPGLGHDLMLDAGGDEVADAMLGWLDAQEQAA
jgi:pimeloyl-ACP methyl ester carboxylesterase